MLLRFALITVASFMALFLSSCQHSVPPRPMGTEGLAAINLKLDQKGGAAFGLRKPLHLVSAIKPGYPRELNEKGLGAHVLVVFAINEDGSIKVARVVNSTDPRFDEEALQATRQWKFEPLQWAKGPRLVYLTQTITFDPEGDYNRKLADAEKKGGNVVPFHYTASKYRKLWADKPEYLALLERRPLVKVPRVLSAGPPEFPRSLLMHGGKAGVDVSFIISEKGTVEAARAIDSTQPAVNRVVEETAMKWRFDPAIGLRGPEKVMWERRVIFTSRATTLELIP